ncbi:unnamed protein product [Phaedon cochleariae]|uniref:Ubiquitin-like domain-containing protein n=1 Tax=Phaedon cochleariae TaxID=80249 RepID=A0A9N9SB39_PHACE|nr:unnamed protein product [Phaedon cochleariae]
MLLKVVTLTGDERMLDVEPTDKILTIKEKLEEKEGIPPEQQRLVFQGKQLKDDKTVNSYKLKGGTVLHLVVALRGGQENYENVEYDLYRKSYYVSPDDQGKARREIWDTSRISEAGFPRKTGERRHDSEQSYKLKGGTDVLHLVEEEKSPERRPSKGQENY